MDSSIPLWIVFAICVVGGAYIAATESSFSAVNKIKIKTMADDGKRRAKGVLFVINRFDKALTTLLVGNNVTKIAAASVATLIATDMFKDKGEAFLNSFGFSIAVSAASTAVVFLLSEMIPKSFANDRSETVSLFFQGSLRFLMKILKPFSAFFGLISDFTSKLFAKKEVEPSITEDELTEIIETAEEEGVVDEEQSDMLKSALEFAKTTVGDIMTMEKDIDFLRINATSEEILEVIRSTNHSRLPVKAENSERVVGILRTRTYLIEYKRNPNLKLRGVLKPPYLVRKDAKIDDLLTDMRQHKQQVAMVLDDRKKVVGLVTIEDILEELVGDIWDDTDVIITECLATGENTYEVLGDMNIDDFFEEIDFIKPESFSCEYSTMGGWAIQMLDADPHVGDSFRYENLFVIVAQMDEERVTKLTVLVEEKKEEEALHD